MTALTAVLALVLQLIAMPYDQAAAGPALAPSDTATVAAELKAAFGGAAELCAHINDQGPPGKHVPFGSCCDRRPLCRFSAEALAFVPPDLPALPQRHGSNGLAIRASPGRDSLPPYPAQPNPARAPPLAV